MKGNLGRAAQGMGRGILMEGGNSGVQVVLYATERECSLPAFAMALRWTAAIFGYRKSKIVVNGIFVLLLRSAADLHR